MLKSEKQDENAPDPQVPIELSNEDFLFKEVRDIHLKGLGKVTTEKLRDIQNIIDKRDNPQSISELSEYVKKIKQMNIAKSKEMLDHHINLATFINNT